MFVSFFFNDTATTEIYTLSLHDALPILRDRAMEIGIVDIVTYPFLFGILHQVDAPKLLWQINHNILGPFVRGLTRSEEHTSELQSRQYLVCRLLLEKKKKISSTQTSYSI